MVATLLQSDARIVPLANRPLPPSERDFGVYEAVVVECASTRTAAEQFGLSQTRIVQIRDRVIEWIGANVPLTPRLDPRQRLQLASDVAGRRLQYFLTEAMEAWRQSQGPQTRVRTDSMGQTITTGQTSYGDVRYLNALARLNEHTIKLIGVVERQERGLEPAEHDRPGDQSGLPFNEDHPPGDCSRGEACEQDATDIAAEAEEATLEAEAGYDQQHERRRAFFAAEEGDASTVQDVCADGLEVRPTVVPLGQRPMSRKQRRARRRLLAKLQRKAK